MMFGHDDHQQHDQNQNNQDAAAPMADDTLGTISPTDTGAPTTPQDDDSAGDFIMDDTPAAAKELPPVPPAVDNTVIAAPKAVDNDELLRIKQEAIHELTPMVDHLDQKPEEKFRTTMMMIQATDNDKLIPAAYAAAKEIIDDKVRAQAYLDIVNEINYFTQAADSEKAA